MTLKSDIVLKWVDLIESKVTCKLEKKGLLGQVICSLVCLKLAIRT